MTTHKSLQFEGFTLDLDRLRLQGPFGPVKLRRKSFEVLRYLVEHAGRVVTKEEMINAVWPNVTVGDESLTQCISEARRGLGDGNQRIIKTIPRRGYLMDVTISVGDIPMIKVMGGTDSATPLPLPDRPSIAVLPFSNMSADPDQEYFADGLVDDIITELSRFQGLFVIARNSSFQYKGKAADVRQVGRDLGVRYVLEGSVRRTEDRVRIAAQLIDAESGGHVWAEKFDHDYADILALQDGITESVVAAIEPEIFGQLKAAVQRARVRPISVRSIAACAAFGIINLGLMTIGRPRAGYVAQSSSTPHWPAPMPRSRGSFRSVAGRATAMTSNSTCRQVKPRRSAPWRWMSAIRVATMRFRS